MKQGEIQDQLARTNLWWRDPHGWTKRDADLRRAEQAPYDYTASSLVDLEPGALYVLRGPRRVGKSVAVKQAIRDLVAGDTDPRLVVYASVDGWRADDLGRLVDAAGRLTAPEGRRFWFMDEVTSVRNGWPHRIKWLRDNDTRFSADTVILTGSSASDMTEAVGVLAGRRAGSGSTDRVLLPMGFRTFAGLTTREPLPTRVGSVQIADLTPDRLAESTYELAPWLHLLVAAWDDYLRVGGFPQAVTAHLRTRDSDPDLQQSLLEVVEHDIFDQADWSRPQTFALLRRLSRNLGSQTNRSAVAEDTDTSPQRVRRRLLDLQEAFALWPCHREQDLRPRLRSQSKLYFSDPIYTQLAPGSAPDATVLSEQQLGLALLRNLERAAPGGHLGFDRVLHHRSRTGSEIDFVGPDFGNLAIESKYVDGRWLGSAKTLRASRRQGIIATRTELNLDHPDVSAVPTAMLAWVLDT